MDQGETEEVSLANVPELLTMLQGCDEELDQAVLEHLCDICDRSVGEAGALLGSLVRSSGALPSLCMQLCSASPTSVELALRLLANLASDAVDPNSADTKDACRRCSLAGPLIRCLDSADEGTLTYACATLQNLCFDSAWARLLSRNGVSERLEHLVATQTNLGYVVRYAAGALQNLSAAAAAADSGLACALSEDARQAVAQRRLLVLRERSAARCLQRHARASRSGPKSPTPSPLAAPTPPATPSEADDDVPIAPARMSSRSAVEARPVRSRVAPPVYVSPYISPPATPRPKGGVVDADADSDSDSAVSEASTVMAIVAPARRVGKILSDWISSSSPSTPSEAWGMRGRQTAQKSPNAVHPRAAPPNLVVMDV